MYELTKHRLARSKQCLEDGDVVELSRPSRLRSYVQAGCFSILAVAEHVDRPVAVSENGWDFPSTLQSAGSHLKISKEDIEQGIELAEKVHRMPPETPSDSELAAARAWSLRIRGCVDAWLKTHPEGDGEQR